MVNGGCAGDATVRKEGADCLEGETEACPAGGKDGKGGRALGSQGGVDLNSASRLASKRKGTSAEKREGGGFLHPIGLEGWGEISPERGKREKDQTRSPTRETKRCNGTPEE